MTPSMVAMDIPLLSCLSSRKIMPAYGLPWCYLLHGTHCTVQLRCCPSEFSARCTWFNMALEVLRGALVFSSSLNECLYSMRCWRGTTDARTAVPTETQQVYCTSTCKNTENELRSLESGLLRQLADVSTATDVDFDLLRMMVRLVITRARALGLQPQGPNVDEVDDGACGKSETQARGGEWGATGEVGEGSGPDRSSANVL